MTATRQKLLLRFLPSLTDVAFLLPIAFVLVHLKGASTLLGDGDTGWHLRTGEWILAHHRVPDTDFFSYTMPGKPWFAWEWLWDVIFAVIHQHLGMQGVVFVNICILGFIYALLFRLIRRSGGNDVVALALTVMAILPSSIHWLARPHLLSWLFPLIFLMLLERIREGRTYLLWWLPLLTILWVNLHGGFFVGIATVGIYAAAEILKPLIFPQDRASLHEVWLRARPYVAATGGCFAASFINPYGWRLHQHLVGYLSNSAVLEQIQEFQSVSFHHPAAIYFEAFLVLGCLAAVWCVIRRDLAGALLLALWSHLALLAVRNIPIFLMIAAPLIARLIQDLTDHLSRAPIAPWLQRFMADLRDLGSEFRPLERIPRFHLISAATALLLGFVMLRAPRLPAALVAQYDSTRFPEKALPFLRSQLPANIFCDDVWAGFLIYRLYPQTRVFFDGRSDFYGPEFGHHYLDILNVNYSWEQQLSLYRVDTVLLRVEAPLAGTLKASQRWVPVYDDGRAIIFRGTAHAGKIVSIETNAAIPLQPKGRG